MALHIGMLFSSFEEFKKALTQYEKDNNVKFVTGKSNSIDAINKTLTAQGVAAADLFQENLKYRYITFTCKFGGQQRIRTGKGERKIQA